MRFPFVFRAGRRFCRSCDKEARTGTKTQFGVEKLYSAPAYSVKTSMSVRRRMQERVSRRCKSYFLKLLRYKECASEKR